MTPPSPPTPASVPAFPSPPGLTPPFTAVDTGRFRQDTLRSRPHRRTLNPHVCDRIAGVRNPCVALLLFA